MSKALKGEHYCLEHQGNHSHYDPKNCTVCKLEEALQEAIDTISFLSNHLQGRMGEGALTEMALKADEWSEALADDGENDVMRSIDPSWADDDTPPGNDARGEALENKLHGIAHAEPGFIAADTSQVAVDRHYWFHVQNTAMAAYRALTAPPTVPEAVREALEDIARGPLQGPGDFGVYAQATAEKALAQHSEPGREDLSFAQLRAANVERCETAFHALDHWNPMEWGAACAGEVGEGINAAKKLRRVQDSEQYKQTLPTTDVTLQDVADEIADAVIYADLWAASIGVDLGAAVADKFNRTSEKVQSDVRLTAPAPDAEKNDG